MPRMIPERYQWRFTHILDVRRAGPYIERCPPMWLVRLALRRPYTFVVMALLIIIVGGASVLRMPTDIFPNIDIPVLTVVFNYGGLTPDEMEKRIVSNYERALTTT